MLQYLIDQLNFTLNGQTYNLITSPWQLILDWIRVYSQQSQNYASSQYVRDAYEHLGKIAVAQSAMVIVLLILCVWLLYKLAHGFIGWMQFR